MQKKSAPRVLVLSRNYPNSVTPILGLWVEGMVRHVARQCEIKVIAPTPYCPPLPGFKGFTKFRSVERRSDVGGLEVFHPRFLTGPGSTTYSIESSTYYWGVRRHFDRLREEFPFDLIHAYFGYPDGVVAAKLAARYGVPLIITEQASWIPWMDNSSKVRNEAVWAASKCSFHVAVSKFARDTIAHFTGETERLRVIPNGVDTHLFAPRRNGAPLNPNQILFVGLPRHVKGIDILLKAMAKLVEKNRDVRLVVVGGGFYRDYKNQEYALHRLARDLGILGNVEFVGSKSPTEVAEYMRKSALLVLPSRTETFGAVLVEALSCGIPVVATRCGGPEDFVNDSVGRLVAKEDPDALASGILDVIRQQNRFDPENLRDYAVRNFSWERIAGQMVDLYGKAVDAASN
jgi:teichuronic acid biosynthesis glycosyltransferase TuaC